MTIQVSSQIDSKVAERAMLNHPFYQAWTEGRLPLDTLRDYSRQYFQVTIDRTIRTLFPYPGIPDELNLQGSARMRLD